MPGTDQLEATASVDAEEHGRLLAHLLHEHHRLPHEIVGVPLDAVHQLEHFDDSVGLLSLSHRHAGSGRPESWP